MLQAMEQKFKDVIQALKGEDNTVKAELQKALKRREDLNSLALPREDFINQFCDLIDKGGSKYPEKLQLAHGSLLTNPMKERNFIHFNPLTLFDHTKISPEAFAYCFKDQMKKGVTEAINAWTWPEEVGPTRAERVKELTKLDKQIEKQQGQLDRIRDLARREGVSLTGVSAGEAEDRHMIKKARKISKDNQ